MSSSIPKIILGTGTVGDASDFQAKYTTAQAVQDLTNLFRRYGHVGIDTARGYSPAAPGSSEALLGQTDIKEWAEIDTKVASFVPGAHSREGIANSVEESLKQLKLPKVHIQYLHAPDRTVPFVETCEAINKAYEAGKFEKFGLSNFSPEEVEEIVDICDKNGWVKPSVYQGKYNAIARKAEEKLIPVLRKHGLSYYAYSPSAAGLFSGNVNKNSGSVHGSRWDTRQILGQRYTELYFKDALFEAAQRVYSEAEKAGLDGHAVGLRWCLHHSAVSAQHGDAIIIGASSIKQMEQNLETCKQGPLPKQLLEAIEDAWAIAKDEAPPAHF